MLLAGCDEAISIEDLFNRFDHRCFKTKKPLDITDRKSWAIDHILPSRYLYPLTVSNAALLSKEANDNKRDRWPSEFYTNNELIKLAKLSGADLKLLSSKKPIINPNIDVDACVTRALSVREQSNLWKRIDELKKMLISYGLADKLSESNKKFLGLT
jgi:CRISPR/Cas system Type II protein with McrA/HNH and RuvC-like nuclease domain